jgi:hypothetical protein
MNDDELEAVLRRFRVAGPEPQLRELILRPGGPSLFWGPAAAAAILVTWVAVHVWSTEPYRDPMRDAAVRTISAALGGGADAMRYAEAAVPPLEDVTRPAVGEEPW